MKFKTILLVSLFCLATHLPAQAAATKANATMDPQVLKQLHDAGAATDTVNTYVTENGRTVYVTLARVPSTNNIKQHVHAYSRLHGKLASYPFFKCDTLSLDNFDVEYSHECDGIQLTRDTKIMHVPVAALEGEHNDRFIIYAFDGNNFVFQGFSRLPNRILCKK